MNKNYKIAMMGNFGLSCGQQCDENHIKDALIELGHTVFENEIPNEVDLILTFKSNKYTAESIKEWKTKTQAPIFIWTFDNCDRFAWVYDIIKECSLWLGEELCRKERFKNEGLPFYYFPNHSCNPKYFHPIESEKEYGVLFSGTPYFPERTEMLKAINNAGIDLHIFGNDSWSWKQHGIENTHPAAFDEELSKVIAKSKIVVGISNTICQGYWSIRPAQVMLCKGFMIDKFVPGMERELKDGCKYWNTHEELIEKIKYYLEHDDEREAIAQKGYEIAISCHTNKQRCSELIKLFENFKVLGKDKFLI